MIVTLFEKYAPGQSAWHGVDGTLGGGLVYSRANMANDVATQDLETVPWSIRFKFGLSRFFFGAVLKCFSLSGLYALGKAFGICEWLVNHKRRRRFHERMKQLFGDQYDRRRMRSACRRYFVRLRCDRIYYLIFDLLPPEKIIRRIHFPQRELIDASDTRGRGVYMAMSHLGAQHVAGLLMCFLGYKTAAVRDRNEGPLRRYVQERFARRFSEVRAARIFYADDLPRDIYRWFQSGGLLGSALDTERAKNPNLKRAAVEIFGEKKEFLTGTIQIALRCKAAIHQGFIVSKPNFHYDLLGSPVLIDPDEGQDTEAVVQELMQAYARNIEAHLREFPELVSRI